MSTREFYDQFSRRFVDDYVERNYRVLRQMELFRQAVPRASRAVLVIGCGSGETARDLASAVVPRAEVLAVDLSERAIELAGRLFAHPRVRFRRVDVIREPIEREGAWDVIVLPDVYEHIPRADRQALHARLQRLLSADGRIVITVPTPAAQQDLVDEGGALQVVDEEVTLDDLRCLAGDVGGQLTYFCSVHVWKTYDYVHAVIARGAGITRPIAEADRVPLHLGRPRSLLRRIAGRLARPFSRVWRRRRALRALAAGSRS